MTVDTGTATILRANARHLPLADNSVDLVVTSPPYFALRSYQDGGEHYSGQIGAEATPAEFVAALLEVTRECVRVLKPSGSMWVNLGDKYAADGPSGPQGTTGQRATRSQAKTYGEASSRQGLKSYGIRSKSLIGIPWRYALACIDDLGLILRAEVIWSKPNGLPESVTDRVRRSHEQWFHFVAQPRYFSAVDEIRERYEAPNATRTFGNVDPSRGDHGKPMARLDARDTMNPLGKLPGSVWTVATEPLRVPDHLGVDHFAAFPTEWPKRIIKGWSPRGVCTACGEGRRPVAQRSADGKTSTAARGGGNAREHGHADFTHINRSEWREGVSYTIDTYACACPTPDAPTTPAVVLDPFGGTGTTALVAKALGRHGISVDMSADYCRLAEWRTTDRNELARVLDMPRVQPQPADQLDLLALLEGSNEG